MGRTTTAALRAALVISLVGSVVIQVLLLALGPRELVDLTAGVRAVFLGLLVVGIGAIQVIGVCVWRLLTMVRRGTVFSGGAFRWVDLTVGALVGGAGVILALGYLLAEVDDAPGVVLLAGGAAVVVGGVALVVRVMRALLAQAVDTRTEAQHLRDELAEVV